jgi:hypothetical protein
MEITDNLFLTRGGTNACRDNYAKEARQSKGKRSNIRLMQSFDFVGKSIVIRPIANLRDLILDA